MRSKPVNRRCVACGEGTLSRVTRSGRVDVYKGITLPIPASLPLVECSACSERYITPSDAKKIDAALAESYRAHVRRRIEAAFGSLQRNGVSIASIQRLLGLSEGYLSKIRRSAEPSFPLVALLVIIAENPASSIETIEMVRRRR